MKAYFRKFGGWYSAACLASLALCWAVAGRDIVALSLKSDIALIVSLLPIYVGALLVGGMVQVLLPKDVVARWLGAESGVRGIFVGTLAGLITPAGPFVSFPLVLALFNAGADVGALVAFISSWALLGIHRVVTWDLPLLGVGLASLRYAVSLPLPIIAGCLARRMAPYFAPRPPSTPA